MKKLVSTLLCVFLYTITLSAQIGKTEAMAVEDYALSEINYSYTTYEDRGRIDCVGQLSFKTNVPDECAQLVLYKTQPHYTTSPDVTETDVTKSDIRFTVCRIIPLETSQTFFQFAQDNIYWGTYFVLQYRLSDNTYFYTPIYNINSFISTSDLDLLVSNASVDCPVDELLEPVYHSDTRTLEVGSSAHLEVYDFSGQLLFKGDISGSHHFDDRYSGIAIIRCIVNQQIFTQKIIL